MYYPTLKEARALAQSGPYGQVPVTRELLSDFITPIQALRILRSQDNHCFLLESAADSQGWGRYSFLGFEPSLEVTCKDGIVQLKSETGETETRFSAPGPVLRDLLARHGFRFSKSMGQNFLIAPAIPYEIAESSRANEQNGVLEIGPGIGALSHELCERAGKVVAVELDKTLLPILDETMARFDNFEVVSADILKTDIPALVREKFAGLTPIVCANLPYNITTPAITALIESKCFESITVLVQKEVAERLCAAPGTSAYGAFSVFMQYYTEPEYLFAVPRECFEPQPKVTSAVLRAVVRREPPVEVEDEKFFFRVVYAAFALRRKTLVNSLMTAFGSQLTKEQVTQAVTSCGLEANIRGERLGLSEFAALAKAIHALV